MYLSSCRQKHKHINFFQKWFQYEEGLALSSEDVKFLHFQVTVNQNPNKLLKQILEYQIEMEVVNTTLCMNLCQKYKPRKQD